MDKHSLEAQKICEMSDIAKTRMFTSRGAKRLEWKLKYDALMERIADIITDEKYSNRLAAFIIPFAALYMVAQVVRAYFF